MRLSAARPLFLLATVTHAFTTPSFLVGPSPSLQCDVLSRSYGGDMATRHNHYSSGTSSTTTSTTLFITREELIKKLNLEPYNVINETEYVQTMSPEERRENLVVIRQLHVYDLPALLRREDWPGYTEANKDKKNREARDPWFKLNSKLKEAVQLADTEVEERVRALIEKVGGPPPGVKIARKYATLFEVYDYPMSLARAESIIEQDKARKARKRDAAEKAQRLAKEKAEAEENRRKQRSMYEEEEADRIRREREADKYFAEQEEERKKAEAKAKEILSRWDKEDPDLAGLSPLERSKALVRREMQAKKEKKKRKRLRNKILSETKDSTDATTSSSSSTSSGTSSSSRRPTDAGGRPRLPGDVDVTRGEITVDIEDHSDVTTDNMRVQVTSDYSAAQSDPPMRKHCFQYTIKITNLSDKDTVQLLSRRFEIQTVLAGQKDVVQGQGVTGRQPILKPGETFEYTSTAPLSVRPIGPTIIAARMRGTYTYSVVDDTIKEEDREQKEAELGTFHFVFPVDQRVKRVIRDDDDEDDDEDDEDDDDIEPVATSSSRARKPKAAAPASSSTLNVPTTLPGDKDMISGDIQLSSTVQDRSDTVSDEVRVSVTSQYREERSDEKLQKHCFAYNIRITNERTDQSIQLVSRKFEIQTVGSPKKDVIQGPGVTGRQPILKPGESFEYTSTAPLSVKPMAKTPVVARMSGEYSFVVLGDDQKSPISSETRKAKLGQFHFVLPQMA